MAKRVKQFEKYSVPVGDSVEFRWRLRAANGEIVIPPESHPNAKDRDAAIRFCMDTSRRTKVVSVED